LGEGELGPHRTQCGQGRGLPACQVASGPVKPFGHSIPTLQTDRTDRQRTDSIGRTVLQTVAQKLGINIAIIVNDISLKTKNFGLHSVADYRKSGYIFNHFQALRSENYRFR